ncbi:DUF1064 domain-containing protein [Collimonas sp. H4R21]|uniref:DUF1064 domain-containing protein n=1 Tax=Collimonas rhizosphaerae TaxID=3126357 RepID=A0ABU9PQK4_9BURK
MRRHSKYGNARVRRGDEKFDSIAEFNRYRQLQMLERAGHITGLTRQVSFILAPKVVINGVAKRSLIYRADFGYTETGSNRQVVEDVKGVLTPVYKIKRHLMKAVHGIDILETK